MNCEYCGNKCQFVELEDIAVRSVEVWKCTNCPQVVRYGKYVDSDKYHMTCIQLKLDSRRYAVHFYTDHDKQYTQIVEAKISGKFFVEHLDFDIEVIAEVPGHPPITPSNIHEKLPIYITFS